MDTRIRQPGAFYYVMQENLRILFVDDDPILREFAAVHLAADNVEIDRGLMRGRDVLIHIAVLPVMLAVAGTLIGPAWSVAHAR